jgi:hypothetical protein
MSPSLPQCGHFSGVSILLILGSEHNVVNVFFHGLAIVLHHLAMLLRQGIVEGNLDHVVGMHGLGHLSVEDFPIHDDLDRIILLELGSGHVSNPR